MWIGGPLRTESPWLNRPHDRVGVRRHESVGLLARSLVTPFEAGFVRFGTVPGRCSAPHDARGGHYVERVLKGRISECAAVDELLARARDSHGDALVVRGEAGVGKTALLEYAASQGVRLLRGTGVQAESEFAYASAHQLLRPLLPLIDSLPSPQADAVHVALGMAPGGPPDRFLVALGFLSLLSEAGREQPLLCLLDDVQWCDSASTDALVFAVRRLSADPVAFLFSVRDEPGTDRFQLTGVPEVAVAGLSEEAGLELLAEAAGAPVPAAVGAALVRYTRGNPLALVELARALSSGQLGGLEPLPDPLPVGDRRRGRLPGSGQASLRRGAGPASPGSGRGVRRTGDHRCCGRGARRRREGDGGG